MGVHPSAHLRLHVDGVADPQEYSLIRLDDAAHDAEVVCDRAGVPVMA